MNIHITQGSGKMQGIQSINTSTINNDFCSKMRTTDSVCSKCYAARYESFRKPLHEALVRNSKVLSESILPTHELPFFNSNIVRFDGFGELINDRHLKNLSNIARKNEHAIFTLWTKQQKLVRDTFKNFEKPSNLILIYSSLLINQEAKKPLYFDKVFTVYDKKTAENVEINCGSKSCLNCRICYSQNDIEFVREILK